MIGDLQRLLTVLLTFTESRSRNRCMLALKWSFYPNHIPNFLPNLKLEFVDFFTFFLEFKIVTSKSENFEVP